MEAIFKVGDRVKVVNLNATDSRQIESKYLGQLGIIAECLGIGVIPEYYIVNFGDGVYNLWFCPDELELYINEKKKEVKERIFDSGPKRDDDSNKLIRRFPSGAVRSDSTGRPRPDWLSPYALEEISKVLVGNVNDFGACNYMLGIKEEACLESLVRHVLELQESILIKKDMKEAKVVARSVGFNIIAMLHTMVLRDKGLYKEIYDKTELVSVEEAKQSNEFLK